MINHSQSFYFSSKSGKIASFDFPFDFEPERSSQGNKKLMKEFISYVSKFGKDIEIPSEILQHLDMDEIDLLLMDIETNIAGSFFIMFEQPNKFLNLVDNIHYSLCGGNGFSLVFESIDGKKINVVNEINAKSIFLPI